MRDIQNRLSRLESAFGTKRLRIHVHGVAPHGEAEPRCPTCDEFGPPGPDDSVIEVIGVDPALQGTQPRPLSPCPPPC